MEEFTQKVSKLRTEDKTLRNRLNDKSALRCEICMDDLLKNDETVKFYTGIPTLACLTAIFNLLKPFAQKLKYWGTNKGKRVNFQKKPSVKKSGKKRSLTIFQEFILNLLDLDQGCLCNTCQTYLLFPKLLVSKVFATWICFLAVTYKTCFIANSSMGLLHIAS